MLTVVAFSRLFVEALSPLMNGEPGLETSIAVRRPA